MKPIDIIDENKGRICLPDDDNPVAEDQDCYTTGWGMVQENGLPSDKLREVKVKRVPLARCNSVLSYGGTKDETMTCDMLQEAKMLVKMTVVAAWFVKSTVSFLRKFNFFLPLLIFFTSAQISLRTNCFINNSILWEVLEKKINVKISGKF